MASIIRKTGELTARGADGRDYRLDVFTEFLPVNGEPGSMEFPGPTTIRLDGVAVARVAKGRYRTVFGFALESDDPAAP